MDVFLLHGLALLCGLFVCFCIQNKHTVLAAVDCMSIS